MNVLLAFAYEGDESASPQLGQEEYIMISTPKKSMLKANAFTKVIEKQVEAAQVDKTLIAKALDNKVLLKKISKQLNKKAIKQNSGLVRIGIIIALAGLLVGLLAPPASGIGYLAVVVGIVLIVLGLI